MLIIALVLALIGLVALVFAVVTSNEVVAWVCIVASVIGVVLLTIDALRERRARAAGDHGEDEADQAGEGEDVYVDYPEELTDADEETAAGESHEDADGDTTQQSAISRDEGSK
jgi:biopolymer transport protein ExbB/TolQ